MGEIVIRTVEDGILLALALTDGLTADITLLYNTAPQDIFKAAQALYQQAAFIEELFQIDRVCFHIRHVISHIGKCQEKNALK